MNEKRASDTLPRPGLVNKVCKEWLVLEDGALAYQLQQQEVSEHLRGNRVRNATVREDIPTARQLQRQAEEEAGRLHALLEEKDRRVAEELARELCRKQESRLQQRSQSMPEGDINEVGLPLPGLPLPGLPLPGLPPPDLSPPPQSSSSSNSHYYEIRSAEKSEEDEEEEEEGWPPPPPPEAELLEELLSREEQERRDRELAARLQAEETLTEELDRKLALEAQDEELARMLHEKEKLRARRAREKARAKQRGEAAGGGGLPSPSLPPPQHLGGVTTPAPAPAPAFLLPPPPPPTFSSTGHLPSSISRGNELPNIAMAIDPTYQRYNTAGGGVRRGDMSPAAAVDLRQQSSRSLPSSSRSHRDKK